MLICNPYGGTDSSEVSRWQDLVGENKLPTNFVINTVTWFRCSKIKHTEWNLMMPFDVWLFYEDDSNFGNEFTLCMPKLILSYKIYQQIFFLKVSKRNISAWHGKLLLLIEHCWWMMAVLWWTPKWLNACIQTELSPCINYYSDLSPLPSLKYYFH